MTKQFMKPQHYKIIDLCIDFLREFEKTYVYVCMDNYFTSYDLAQEFTEREILTFGTIRMQVLHDIFMIIQIVSLVIGMHDLNRRNKLILEIELSKGVPVSFSPTRPIIFFLHADWLER